MNETGWKERVQDYLDDRMDAGQRAAFEAELSRHPERAAEVERNRELGALLREEKIDLPPGLARRARARFEASRHPSRSPWIRWAWPAAALAGAAMLMLTFGLFAPTPNEGPLEPPEPTRITRAQAPKQEIATAPSAEAQDKLEEALADSAPLEKKRPRTAEEAEAAPQFAPAPAAAPARSSADADLRASVATGDDALPGRKESQAELEGQAEDDAKIDAVGKSRYRAKSASEVDPVATTGRRDESLTRDREYAANAPSPSAAPEPSLLAGVRLESRIDPGRSLVEDPQELTRWLDKEPILRQSGFDPRRQRLVLVGGLPETFPCSSLRLASALDGYRLIEPGSDGFRRQEAGGERSCALVVPRDGQPVRLSPDLPQ